MTGFYASGTSTPIANSRAEIERLLRKYGADQFGYMEDAGRAALVFRAQGKAVRFHIEMPGWREFKSSPKGKTRTDVQAQSLWEGELRRRWRVLMLVIKAKFEAVAAGVCVFEQEFLGQLVLPGGQTVFERAMPAIETAYASGKPPDLLLGHIGKER